MRTTTESAAIIRATLKSKGISSRQVSVRAEYYSMGSSLHVVIKDPRVSLALVEAIANEHEHIDRDQFGDILAGGNTYLHVGYSSAARDVLGAAYHDAVAKAVDELTTAGEHALIPVTGTPFTIGHSQYGGSLSLWGESHISSANDADGVAELIGMKLGLTHV